MDKLLYIPPYKNKLKYITEYDEKTLIKVIERQRKAMKIFKRDINKSKI